MIIVSAAALSNGYLPRLAGRFLKGTGLEIGALYKPLAVPGGCRVTVR